MIVYGYGVRGTGSGCTAFVQLPNAMISGCRTIAGRLYEGIHPIRGMTRARNFAAATTDADS